MPEPAMTPSQAFEHLVATKQIRGKPAVILDRLIAIGPATSGEVLASLPDVTNINMWRARFSELQARGLIQEVGERKCRISGRPSVVWAATARTKPLNVRKGARGSDGRAWKGVAVKLAKELGRVSPGAPALVAFRKLSGRP